MTESINTCEYLYVLLDDDLEAAAVLLKALASPLRLAIVLELRSGERCVHELVDAIGASQPLISQHLRTLREADVIVGHRRGREIGYQLADEHITHIAIDAIAHAGEATGTTHSEHPSPTPGDA